MKETKLKRLIKKMMDSIFLDAMTPEFKAANAELLKAIKMNDKSGAVPHADLEAVNKAMKENDAEKAGSALKKVQLQFSKAEKKLDDDVKAVQAKLETTKKAAETAKTSLKQKKALASVFDKLKTLVSGLSNNPKNASKLTALTDKVKEYGDLSKRASQIITLVSSNKDASKQIDMLKKSVDVAEKKYKKDLANAEKESKKANDALEVAKMQVKITHGKKDAFTKERLYIANVVKQMPSGDLRKGREQKQEEITEPPGVKYLRFEADLSKAAGVYERIAKVDSEWRNRFEREKEIYKENTKQFDRTISAIEKLIKEAESIKFHTAPPLDNTINDDIINSIGNGNAGTMNALKLAKNRSNTLDRFRKQGMFKLGDIDKSIKISLIYDKIYDLILDAEDVETDGYITRPDLTPKEREKVFKRIVEQYNSKNYEALGNMLKEYGVSKIPDSFKSFEEILTKAFVKKYGVQPRG